MTEIGNFYRILEKKDSSIPDKNSILKIISENEDTYFYEILYGNFKYNKRFKKSSNFLNYCKKLDDLSEIQQYLPFGHSDKWFTIEDLRNGKCAIINDGTLEELKTVLEYSYPKDNSFLGGLNPFYYSYNYNNWIGISKVDLPKQSVKLFLKQIKTMEKEFVLPKKWFLKVNMNNWEIIFKWANYNWTFTNDFEYIIWNGNSNWYFKDKETMKRNIIITNKENFQDYQEITFEQFKKHVLNNTNMKTQGLTLGQLKDLRLKDSCEIWINTIDWYLNVYQRVLDTEFIEIKQEDLDYATKSCSEKQLQLLKDAGLVFEEKYPYKENDWFVFTESEEICKITKIKTFSDGIWISYTNNTNKEGSFKYTTNKNKIRKATQKEIDYASIEWDKLKTGSVVMIEHNNKLSYNSNIKYDKPFNIVFYKTLYGINPNGLFKTGFSQLCTTFEQDGKFVLFSSNEVCITKVISY